MEILDLHRQFRRYLSIEEGLAPKTVNAMESYFKTFLRRTTIQRLGDVYACVLQEFFYEGKEKYQWSHSSYINHHKYLKRFFDWCIARGLLKENPINAIKRPKKPRSLPRRLEDTEAKKILYTAFTCDWRYDFERTRNHAMMATFLYAGLRLNELINLEITDINSNADNMLIRCGKGNKDRNVPVYYKLSRILKNYLKERDKKNNNGPYVFQGIKGDKKLREKDVWRVCKRIGKEIGIQFTPHQLRHTFGSISVEQGLDIVKLKEIMGHSEITSTMIYLKMSSKNLKDSLNNIDFL
ncbi:MAG: integrase/recombinase, integrase/recombinase XerD [Candidatus Peregrinibacteria bacterium GW2011_GWF2_43_17]|nr:MAG: integrase/recombinase, integrase/recombinase XerD [Candidatus Peregrinibacteria bacterium GW2011_GWF2_43_17]KKT19564.1 MAG: putative tyrosine recombinase XerC-like protein [Candidatus Peregrinibacteria bacterium GW2011_GWA2_43_8]HAU39990.1 hypothetical protein [Candidatus Peregrinibacteria bacterium]